MSAGSLEVHLVGWKACHLVEPMDGTMVDLKGNLSVGLMVSPMVEKLADQTVGWLGGY